MSRVRLEPDYWTALDAIASAQGVEFDTLASALDRAPPEIPLARKLRLFVVAHYRTFLAPGTD